MKEKYPDYKERLTKNPELLKIIETIDEEDNPIVVTFSLNKLQLHKKKLSSPKKT